LAQVQFFEKSFHRSAGLLAKEMDERVFGRGVRGPGFFFAPNVESIGLDVHLESFDTFAEIFNDPVGFALLVGCGLEKLDAHSEFRMRESDDAGRADGGSGVRHGKNDPAELRKWGTGDQVAGSVAEIL
jgi:hypothetical protein